MADHYEYSRENDLTLTHSLLNLQRRCGASAVDTMSDGVALTVVKETDALVENFIMVIPGEGLGLFR